MARGGNREIFLDAMGAGEEMVARGARRCRGERRVKNRNSIRGESGCGKSKDAAMGGNP